MLADVIAIVADVIATYFVNLAGVIWQYVKYMSKYGNNICHLQKYPHITNNKCGITISHTYGNDICQNVVQDIPHIP